MERLVDIDVDAVGIKAKIKKELYDMISGVDGVYLPPIKDCNYKSIQQF